MADYSILLVSRPVETLFAGQSIIESQILVSAKVLDES
jgi:hypothetical protein